MVDAAFVLNLSNEGLRLLPSNATTRPSLSTALLGGGGTARWQWRLKEENQVDNRLSMSEVG